MRTYDAEVQTRWSAASHYSPATRLCTVGKSAADSEHKCAL